MVGLNLILLSDSQSEQYVRLVCSCPQVSGTVGAPEPGLSALASAKSSPFQASQGSPCSRELSFGMKNLGLKSMGTNPELPGQVRQHFVHRSIWDVLVNAEACLACGKCFNNLKIVDWVRSNLPR